MEYWNSTAETMPRQELEQWKWRRLQAAMDHARRLSPFWRERLPENITSMADYAARVPLLRKADLLAAEAASPLRHLALAGSGARSAPSPDQRHQR